MQETEHITACFLLQLGNTPGVKFHTNCYVNDQLLVPTVFTLRTRSLQTVFTFVYLFLYLLCMCTFACTRHGVHVGASSLLPLRGS